MVIILTGGKTMGHISPLLAINNCFKTKATVYYIGLAKSMEEKCCKEEEINFISIKAYPFYKKALYKNLLTFYTIFKEKKRLKKIIKEKVDYIYTTGGFVSVAPLLAFKNQKTRKILLESNLKKGLASKLLSLYVDEVRYQFPSFKDKKGNLKAMPVLIKKPTFQPLIMTNERKILFVGGSNGAEEIVELASKFSISYQDIKICVLTGKTDYNYLFSKNSIVLKNIPNLVGILPYFSLIVSRAGGATISEIIYQEIPAVLYPSKYVANNHQYQNACELAKIGGAIIITSTRAVKDIYMLFTNEKKLFELKNNLKTFKNIYK